MVHQGYSHEYGCLPNGNMYKYVLELHGTALKSFNAEAPGEFFWLLRLHNAFSFFFGGMISPNAEEIILIVQIVT